MPLLPDDDEPCVRRVPVFARLTAPQQEAVARRARPVTAAAGEFVMRAGQRSARLLVVHAGSLKVARTSPAGRETILRVAGPGDVVGETPFLTGAPPENDAVALSPAKLCVFDHADLAGLLAQMPDIGVGMLRALALKLASAERMLAALTSWDVGARVAAYLLDCPTTWGADGRAVVHLPMPKNQVAAYLGTTPETLSRRLARFERAGLIRLRPGRDVDIVDIAGLEARAAGT